MFCKIMSRRIRISLQVAARIVRNSVSLIEKGLRGIGILSNYLSEFERIRTGNCEREFMGPT